MILQEFKKKSWFYLKYIYREEFLYGKTFGLLP